MTYSQTIDLGTFNEDFPRYILRAIENYYRLNYRRPRYILLGRKELHYLRMEWNHRGYLLTFSTDSTKKEAFHGIDILCVDRESFFDVVG